jgi:uncharacterized membrane protein
MSEQLREKVEIREDEGGEPTAEEILAEARRRMEEREQEPEEETPSPGRRGTVVRANRMVFWLSKHWLALFNALVGLYVAGAFLAPVLMNYGYEAAGRAIYNVYAPFCHQYPVRSWFLFGAQAAYRPDGALLAEELHKLSSFAGNATLGYKVAFCQRDVAIYGSMLLGGLAYVALRKRWEIEPLSMRAYLIVGILPMGLDGGYQLLTNVVAWLDSTVIPAMRTGADVLQRLAGVLDFLTPAWMGPHETTPLLRTITGTLFGLASIGVVYPYINEFFEETRALLSSRFGWE